MTAPDGSPVEAYAALPAEPELTVVRAHARGRHTVLDLGAGTGRLADPLALAGHDVVAVDADAAMLARVRHAAPVLADIETLDLGRCFELVLLLAYLINSADDERRAAFLGTATRHLAPGGLLLLQRLDPAHAWREGRATAGPLGVGLEELDLSGWPWVRGTTTYTLGAHTWRQPWVQRVLDDTETSAALDAAGLRLRGAEGAWVTAVGLDGARDAVGDRPL